MLSFFPRDVLDDIWDLIESVSEGFPIYSSEYKAESLGQIKVYGPYSQMHAVDVPRYFHSYKSRKETPQKLTQLRSRSHPRHLVGKTDSTK